MTLTKLDGSPVRVLAVDDEVNLAELSSMALRYEGSEVSVAHGGKEAVATAKSFLPDVVVLDMMLPDFDGPDASQYRVMSALSHWPGEVWASPWRRPHRPGPERESDEGARYRTCEDCQQRRRSNQSPPLRATQHDKSPGEPGPPALGESLQS